MLPGANCANDKSELASLVLQKISIGPAKAPCDLVPGAIAIDSRGGESYVIFPFTGACEVLGSQVRVGYDLMFGSDAQHRGLVDLRNGDIGRSTVMTPETRVAVLDLESDNRLDVIRSFISHGAHHIWSGYDHLLFLVTLLLPAVVMRSGNAWRPVETLGGAFWATTRIVTAFTLAHSITLSVAAFGIVDYSRASWKASSPLRSRSQRSTTSSPSYLDGRGSWCLCSG